MGFTACMHYYTHEYRIFILDSLVVSSTFAPTIIPSFWSTYFQVSLYLLIRWFDLSCKTSERGNFSKKFATPKIGCQLQLLVSEHRGMMEMQSIHRIRSIQTAWSHAEIQTKGRFEPGILLGTSTQASPKESVSSSLPAPRIMDVYPRRSRCHHKSIPPSSSARRYSETTNKSASSDVYHISAWARVHLWTESRGTAVRKCKAVIANPSLVYTGDSNGMG